MPECWLFIQCRSGPTPECFKHIKVTIPECWLFVVLGISMNALSVQMSPCLNVGYLFWWGPMPVFKYKTSPQLNIVLGGGDQCPNVLSAKRPKHLNVGYSDVTFFT